MINSTFKMLRLKMQETPPRLTDSQGMKEFLQLTRDALTFWNKQQKLGLHVSLDIEDEHSCLAEWTGIIETNQTKLDSRLKIKVSVTNNKTLDFYIRLETTADYPVYRNVWLITGNNAPNLHVLQSELTSIKKLWDLTKIVQGKFSDSMMLSFWVEYVYEAGEKGQLETLTRHHLPAVNFLLDHPDGEEMLGYQQYHRLSLARLDDDSKGTDLP